MRIHLKHRYRGAKTNEQWIEPGDYDANDPAVDGFAQYLIDNDHAVELDLPVKVQPPTVTPSPAPLDMTHHNEEMKRAGRDEWKAETEDNPQDYDLLTRDELFLIAKADGLEVVGTGKNGRVTKQDFLVALQAKDNILWS